MIPSRGPERALAPLLAVAFFLNYIDRGNLPTVAPLIQAQLHFSSTQIGVLVSAFFWTYVPGQVLAGWLAQGVDPYRTLTWGFIAWSAATVLSGVATAFNTLIVLRLLLGLGESAAVPCSSELLVRHLPSARLGRANGLLGVGMGLGPAMGTLAGGLLMARFGWRAVFLVLGVAPLLWLMPWRRVSKQLRPRAQPPSDAAEPTFAALLRRELWGAALGQFGGNYAFYFVISWLPSYLMGPRGLSPAQMAGLGASVYLTYSVASWTAGWMADGFVRRGLSNATVRKAFILSAHLLMSISLVIAAGAELSMTIASLFVAAVAFGMNTSTVYAIAQTLAGAGAAARWVGIQNSVANLAGIAGPIMTGWILDRSGEYYWAFMLAAVLPAVGMIGWGLIIRRIAPLSWSGATAAPGGSRP